MPDIQIGTTFSHPHISHLGYSVEEALDYALSLKLSHIRLGSYWSRVETSKNSYDFRELERLLEMCERAKQPIIMNVGMKSPRWPEFYLPPYIANIDIGSNQVKERVLLFIEKTIIKFKSYSCITYWQVENEPRDPSGKFNLVIPHELLQEEVRLVRLLDSRLIVISLWGNELTKRKLLPGVLPLADRVGLDIYYKLYITNLFGKSFYIGPQTNDNEIRKLIKNNSKPILITELQAEPWEKDEKTNLSENQKSISPDLLRNNIKRAIDLGVKEILLWGFEYWYYQMKKGNNSYMNILKEFGYHTPSGEALVAAAGDR